MRTRVRFGDIVESGVLGWIRGRRRGNEGWFGVIVVGSSRRFTFCIFRVRFFGLSLFEFEVNVRIISL